MGQNLKLLSLSGFLNILSQVESVKKLLTSFYFYFFDNIHCHIVGTMFFEGQFPISPRVVLNFFEKLCEITHFKKNPIVTTSVDNDKAKLIVPTSEDNEKSHCHH